MNDSYRYYVIRHIRTGELMPQMKRDRGYSHWNPDNPKEINNRLGVPRLLDTRRRAFRCILQWVIMPNSYRSIQMSYYGDESDTIEIKPDGRKKEDLEIVEVNLDLLPVPKPLT